MATFSTHFELAKSQAELDFVDIRLERDTPLFVDPFALSQRQDRWGQDAHAHLLAFFQQIIDYIRAGRHDEARRLLRHLKEPNETRFGFSHGRPQGAGIGPAQADDLFRALRDSQAIVVGILGSLEECELMIDGIGPDKISDLTTNVLRRQLAEYTLEQCDLHGVETREVAVGPHYSLEIRDWMNQYFRLPVIDGKAVMLVPKVIARFKPAYNHQAYYRHFALDYLQTEHLDAGSGLVRALKNGKKRVYKKDLEARYPCTKEFLLQFSKDHPEALVDYRETLNSFQRRGLRSEVEPGDEPAIAGALRAALAATPPGDDAASQYHRLMIGVLEFVFFPTLICPRKEHEIHQGRKRIDIVMENAAMGGIFHRLHVVRHLPSAYIAIECKNYRQDIANPELDQISGRFSPNRGIVGIVCCRAFENRARFVERCRDTFRDQRGLVIAIDDLIVASLLRLIETDRRQDIDDQIGRLVDDVCMV